MNVNEAFDVLEKSVMYPQRVQACEWLNAGGFPPPGGGGTPPGGVPPPAGSPTPPPAGRAAGWLSNPPPECVVQALAAAGFGLHWASHAPDAALLMLLPLEGRDDLQAERPEDGRSCGNSAPVPAR